MRSVVLEMVMIDMHYYNNVVIFLGKTTYNTTIVALTNTATGMILLLVRAILDRCLTIM